MRKYFFLVNNQEKGIKALVKSLNYPFALPDCIVLEDEETALFIKNNVKDMRYCKQLPDLMEALISSKSVCTNNRIFLEAIEELRIFAHRKELFNHSLVINDRFPWLKTLPNGEYEVNVDPVFLEPFQYYASVITDEGNNAELLKYCQLTGINGRCSLSF